MDDGLSSASGASPAGFTSRWSPVNAPGLWHAFADAGPGRVAVVIGCCADVGEAQRLQADTSTRLHAGADPAGVLSGIGAGDAAILAAVIDRTDSRMSYSSLGVAAPALAAPDMPRRALEPTRGRQADAVLPPGTRVLLCTGELTGLDAWESSVCGAGALDDLIAGFTVSDDVPGLVAVLYRHPPPPLDLIVPAEPASLAVVRRQLRTWLAMTGADEEMCADLLLAVGEAATNAAEHSHDGTGRSVQLTVSAWSAGDGLRFTVSDNGSWKTPAESPGHRGHGIRLMKALTDSVAVTTTARGTTVEMFKELAG